ncbi:NYN domain-containing protein [Cubamyces lactineus]|nr:NYN domain-containing protein [Cubamyces lactineus]
MGRKDLLDEHEDVAIFWDYENCTPPCNVPGYDVVNNIRQVAHEYGSVKLFKAYLELSEQSSSKSIGLRSELQSCGVSLTDCPHNGRKDVADKMMIVDMLTYAIDNPAPATIVLISGDRDFVYAVSVLRLRRYRVVVVAPYTAHGSLKSQASVVLDWEADIMRKTTTRGQPPDGYQAPMDDAQHRSPRRPPLAMNGPFPQVTPKSQRRASFRVAAPTQPACLDGGAAMESAPYQGRHLRSTSSVTIDGSLRSEAPNLTDRPMYHHRVPRPATVGSLMREREDEDMMQMEDRRPIPSIVDVLDNLRERRSQESRPTSRLEIPVSSEEVAPNHMSSTSRPVVAERDSFVMPPSERSRQTNLTPPSDDIEEHLGLSSQTAAFPGLSYGHSIVHPVTVETVSGTSSEYSLLSMPTSSSLESPTPIHVETSRAPREPSQPSSSPPIGHISQAVSLEQSVESRAPVSIPDPPAPNAMPVPFASELQTTQPGDTRVVDPDPECVPAASLPPQPIPAHFIHLVQVLEEFRARGSDQPLRSTIALRLVQVAKDIYQRAGMGTFKQYSLAASTAGIVLLGGIHGDAWISLSPRYYDIINALSVPS